MNKIFFNFHLTLLLLIMALVACTSEDNAKKSDVPTAKVYYAYEREGENLYIAYNDGCGTEFCYWFTKCMANNLYTFFRAGFRPVTDRDYPSTTGISSQIGISNINVVYSDNIGPILYTSTAGQGGQSWVGGNHHYPNETDASIYLTAENVGFDIIADGKNILDGDSGLCSTLSVSVHNTIFSPGYLPEEGSTSLSVPLCQEEVTYVIEKNNIEVDLKHTYSFNAQGRINVYYGMQSMFHDEEYIMTPNGLRSNWYAASTNDSFTKSAYPYFNRFIEKNATVGYYQASYLLTDFGLGKHDKIDDNDDIYIRSGSKCYHKLMSNIDIKGGEVYQWFGIYTFFNKPIIDDEYLFVYSGVVRGKDVLFINSKQAFIGSIPIPTDFSQKKYSVIENHGFADIDDGLNIGGGIYVESNSEGSLILQFD